MPKPIFEPIIYKGSPRIKVSFENNDAWNKRMKQVPGAMWSMTLRSWHIPDTKENRERCGLQPKEYSVIRNTDDHSLQKRLQDVAEKIKLKGYSRNTGENYCQHLKEYFEIISLKYDPEKVNKPIIEKYLLWRLEKKQSSESDVRHGMTQFQTQGKTTIQRLLKNE
ncbi:MAG TPA: phage integrase N-terminal SAM-like domain-containing protein [Chitinophagaceae bacterium]